MGRGWRTAARSVGSLALFAGALASCADRGGSGPQAVQSVDSAGITIVTSSAPVAAPGEGWSLSPEPALSIGVTEGEDPYQLVRVSDAMRLADGRIVLTDAGARDTRIYDAEGTWIRTLGGPGQGPEEYRVPTALIPRPDGGFTVVDFMDRVHYGPGGDFLERETFDRARWTEIVSPLGPSEGGQPLADGRVVAPVYGEGFSAADPSVGPPFRPRITMVRVDLSTGAVDTLTRIGGILQQYVDVGRERPSATVGPFAPSGRWFVGRDGSVVVYDGAPPQVERWEPDGRHRIFRWTGEPQPVTEAEVEAWKEEQRNAPWAQDRLPELERGWAAVEMPEVKPWVSGALPAADGSTWVRMGAQAPGGASEWRVFGPEGAWVASLTLPPGFRPTDAGDGWVLGVQSDASLGVERVRMYLVERG